MGGEELQVEGQRTVQGESSVQGEGGLGVPPPFPRPQKATQHHPWLRPPECWNQEAMTMLWPWCAPGI